jgi:ornithine decarboxylase
MPDFIAKNLASHIKTYAESLKTPFFGAMVDYADAGNQMWTCPGHNGGVFYWKSPVGRLFVEHLGEAIFRNDIDNSVVEMGDLLTHEGPAQRAEKEAAIIFGAERTYFVLNGTWFYSTATITNPTITAPSCWPAAFRSISKPAATRMA